MKESHALANCIFETNYNNLPPGVVRVTKKSILDGLGVILGAGTMGEGCRTFVDLAKSGGGKEESTIIGFGTRVPSYMAALANGSMAHALDFEDAHEGALVHSNSAAIPAAIAMAEAVGRVSGKELITAITLGSEIVCRLGLALRDNPLEYGWYTPAVLGGFGATAAASKILGLTPAQIVDAFSLCLCQSTCSAELVYSSKSIIRAVREGFIAKAGVLSAILAQKGIIGFEEPIEGRAGLFALYARGEYDPQVLVKDFGTVFESENIAYKAWPSCRGTHAYIEGALAIVREYDVKPSDIESVKVIVGEKSINRRLCEPLEKKQHPTVAIDAKFSIPFSVATALVRREVTLDSFTPEALQNPQIISIAEKVTYETEARDDWKDSVGGYIEVTIKGIGTISKNIDFVYGHPQNPIDDETLMAKFVNCASHAAKPIDAANVMRVIMDLENMRDINEMVQEF